jgi:lambda repressor-like predicted transcriptional regulator
MSAALLKPSRGCNEIIAKKIGVSLHELWPDWFDSSGRLISRNATRSRRGRSSQKRNEKLTLTRRRA